MQTINIYIDCICASGQIQKEQCMKLKGRQWVRLAPIMFILTLSICALKNELNQIEIVDPDLSKAADGTWTGEWNTSLVKAQVSVNTTSHQITKIDILRHDCGKGKPAEAIVDRVIQAQSLQVDAVSGATGSSKVILRAIQDGLEKAVTAGKGTL